MHSGTQESRLTSCCPDAEVPASPVSQRTDSPCWMAKAGGKPWAPGNGPEMIPGPAGQGHTEERVRLTKQEGKRARNADKAKTCREHEEHKQEGRGV